MSFPKGWKRPRGRCKECGRLFALGAPSGDWLNAIYPRKHDKEGMIGTRCPGSFMETTIEISEQRQALSRAGKE